MHPLRQRIQRCLVLHQRRDRRVVFGELRQATPPRANPCPWPNWRFTKEPTAKKYFWKARRRRGKSLSTHPTLGSRVLYLKNSRRNIPSSKPTFGAATRNHCCGG